MVDLSTYRNVALYNRGVTLVPVNCLAWRAVDPPVVDKLGVYSERLKENVPRERLKRDISYDVQRVK